MATRRAASRRDARQRRRAGPETTIYGGSDGALADMRRHNKIDDANARIRENKADKALSDQLGKTDESADRAYKTARDLEREGRGDRRGARDAIGGIQSGADGAADTRNSALQSSMGTLNNALGRNALTGSAESVLAQRKAELAGVPTIGQATDTALAANQANANANLANQIGMQNRAARGMAGSMGEGGALAMQQAMASAGANAGDQAAQNQMQQAQLAAQMRFGAAQQQNQQDLATANLGTDLRMGAAEAERQNQMNVAGANAASQMGVGDANAAMGYDAGLQRSNAAQGLAGLTTGAANAAQGASTQLQGLGQSAANAYGDFANNVRGQVNQNTLGVENAAAGVDAANKSAAYADAMAKRGGQKMAQGLGGVTSIIGSFFSGGGGTAKEN